MNIYRYLAILMTTMTFVLHAGAEDLKNCDSNNGPFSAFPGNYTMKLNMNGTDFFDQLVISSTSQHPGMINFKQIFQGTFTVPGVFTADVENGLLQYGMWSDQLYLSFNITATENGASFPVYFRAQSSSADQACLMTGKAYSRTPEKEMGTFILTKNTDDCRCIP